MNKTWGDRADKDLFFTILSVKNIGVISGAEWTTIGNHMRSLGYGFTNEGCRQHFQGLRRAQNKAGGNGSPSNSPRKVDPTLNPITRRPGPGRGRPSKQQQHPLPVAEVGQAAAVPMALDPSQQPPPPPDGAMPAPASASIPVDLQQIPRLPQHEIQEDSELEEPSPKRHKMNDATDIDEASILSLAAAETNPHPVVDHYTSNAYFDEA